MENAVKNSTVESTLGRYLEFKIFEIFKNRLVPEIAPHCREGSKEDLYRHIFLCPSQSSKKRNFQLHGVLSPFVCLWRTSLLNWNEEQTLYARSVLPRDFYYTGTDGRQKCERGFLYDLQFDLELFSSSYYKTFRDRVNQDLIDLDRLRYFNIDIKEMFKDSEKVNTRIELLLKDMKPTDNVMEDQNNRSFDLNATYTVKITVPYCHSDTYLTGISLYLNERQIYLHDGETEIIPGKKVKY
jgi:hypothetical protein